MKAALALVAVGVLALVALLLRGLEREPVRVEPTGGAEELAGGASGARAHEPARAEAAGEAASAPARSIDAPEEATGPARPSAERAYPFSLRVALVDEAGARIECCGVELRVVDVRGLARTGYVHRPGFYELRELDPGRWWLRASAIGRRAVVRELLLPSSDAALELELELPANPLVRVRVVTPDGADFASARPAGFDAPRVLVGLALPGARVGPENELAGLALARLFTRDQLDLEPGELGRLELRRDPPLWVSLVVGEEVLESSWLAPGVAELVFTLDPERLAERFGEVWVRAVDAGGAQLQFATATLAGRRGFPRVFEPAGGLCLRQVPAGVGTLELAAPGYEARLVDVEVRRGEPLDLGDVTLAPAANVAAPGVRSEGHFDSGSGAVRGANVRLRWAPGAGGTGGRWIEEPVGPEETATLLLLPSARRLQVVLSGPDPRLRRERPIDLFGVPERLELQPGEYELRAYADDGTRRSERFTLPAAGLTLQLD